MKPREARGDVRLAIRLKYPDRTSFVERFAINLSRTGVFLRTPTPLPVGSRVHFEYRLSDGQRMLRGRGIVRWSREESQSRHSEPPGMGIEFVDLDATSEALVEEIVTSHGDGAHAPQRRLASALSPPSVSGGGLHTSPQRMALPQVGIIEGKDTALDAIDALGDTLESKAAPGTNSAKIPPQELTLSEDEFALALELGESSSRLNLVTTVDTARQRTLVGGRGDTEEILIERFAAQVAVSAEELCHEINATPTMLRAFVLDVGNLIDERITQALHQRFPNKLVNGRVEGKTLVLSADTSR